MAKIQRRQVRIDRDDAASDRYVATVHIVDRKSPYAGFAFDFEVWPDGRLRAFTMRATINREITPELARAPIATLRGFVVDECRRQVLADTLERGSVLQRARRRSLQAHARAATPSGPGRPPNSERYWAEIARDYVAAFGRDPIRPVAELARARGGDVVQWKNRVFKAREKDYLTSPGPGQAGGELTDKARRALEEG